VGQSALARRERYSATGMSHAHPDSCCPARCRDLVRLLGSEVHTLFFRAMPCRVRESGTVIRARVETAGAATASEPSWERGTGTFSVPATDNTCQRPMRGHKFRNAQPTARPFACWRRTAL
jgi:hypothetical protein